MWGKIQSVPLVKEIVPTGCTKKLFPVLFWLRELTEMTGPVRRLLDVESQEGKELVNGVMEGGSWGMENIGMEICASFLTTVEMGTVQLVLILHSLEFTSIHI